MPEHTGDDVRRLGASPRFHPPGLIFKNALEAHEWHEIDGQGGAWDHDGELKCRDEPATWEEWRRWRAATERLGDLPWERIVNPDQERVLRYVLKCSIGQLEEAPSATSDRGYTDDLEVAAWHSDRSEYPGWDVYDLWEDRWAGGGGPIHETYQRLKVEAWIAELTRPGWALYPYLHGDAVSQKHREDADATALKESPDWRPAPEAILAPLRCALYVAMGVERAALNEEPPGKLSNYPDGRDLEPGWIGPYDVTDRRITWSSPRGPCATHVVQDTEPGARASARSLMANGAWPIPEGSTVNDELRYVTVTPVP